MFFGSSISQLSSQEFADKLQNESNVELLDIRSPEEYEQAHIEGARLMNIHAPDFQEQLQKLNRDKTYLLYCRSGNRSGQACRMMESMGFEKVYNLQYGIMDWINHFEVVQP
ncbi:MAG: rhodanese-like domain-containing protein [Bacteroidota bacterium]